MQPEKVLSHATTWESTYNQEDAAVSKLSCFISHPTLQQQKLSAIARSTQCHANSIDDAAVFLQSLQTGVLSIPLTVPAFIFVVASARVCRL